LRRDWYGYELGVGELERFAAYVLDRRHLPTADLVNQVALAMLTYEAPMIAESVEEMASDEHIETLVRITLEAVAAAQEASAWTEEER
jgi:hypothetical protein